MSTPSVIMYVCVSAIDDCVHSLALSLHLSRSMCVCESVPTNIDAQLLFTPANVQVSCEKINIKNSKSQHIAVSACHSPPLHALHTVTPTLARPFTHLTDS